MMCALFGYMGFYGFDPVYFLFVGPAILLAIWAQWRVKSAYAIAGEEPVSSGMSGAQAARRILDNNGLTQVEIEPTEGMLSDHYDPRHKVLRLSPDVYEGRTLAAVGIAAHEAGHALQDATAYGPLKLRNGLVPLANTGGMLSMLVIMIGFGLMTASGNPLFGRNVILIGIGLFSLTVVFQLVNLPVEFDASARAKGLLVNYGIVGPSEMRPVERVLSAAAMTYVAATISSIMTLLYYLYRAGIIGGRRE